MQNRVWDVTFFDIECGNQNLWYEYICFVMIDLLNDMHWGELLIKKKKIVLRGKFFGKLLPCALHLNMPFTS